VLPNCGPARPEQRESSHPCGLRRARGRASYVRWCVSRRNHPAKARGRQKKEPRDSPAPGPPTTHSPTPPEPLSATTLPSDCGPNRVKARSGGPGPSCSAAIVPRSATEQMSSTARRERRLSRSSPIGYSPSHASTPSPRSTGWVGDRDGRPGARLSRPAHARDVVPQRLSLGWHPGT
jgi:hypothetical protein